MQECINVEDDSPPILLPAISPFPSSPRLSLRKCAHVEEVWDGKEAAISDDEECNFLGYRIASPKENGESDRSLPELMDEDQDISVVYVNISTTGKKKRKRHDNPYLFRKKKKSKSKYKQRVLHNLLSSHHMTNGSVIEREKSGIDNENSDIDNENSAVENGNSAIENEHSTIEDERLSERESSDLELPPEICTPPRTPLRRRKNYFIPSSKRGYNGWEDCLRQRPAQVQHYQSIISMRNRSLTTRENDQTSGKSKNAKNTVCSPPQKKSKKNNKKVESIYRDPSDLLEDDASNSDEDNLKNLDAVVGEVIWAKLGSTRWWPAMVIWGLHCGQQASRAGVTWVFWFGDHKISELPRDRLLPFISEFKKKYSDYAGKVFDRAVMEALTILAVRAEIEFEEGNFDRLLKWAKGGFNNSSSRVDPFEPDPTKPYSEAVTKHLDRIKGQYIRSSQKTDNSSSQCTSKEHNEKQGVEVWRSWLSAERFVHQGIALSKLPMQMMSDFRSKEVYLLPYPRHSISENDSVLAEVRKGERKISDICIGCYTSDQEIIVQHPLFDGGLCRKCKENITETMFAFGDDGTNTYCVICAEPGDLLICDNNDCNRCYCFGCIDKLVGPGAHEKVLEISPWLCYLCADYDPERNGLIQPKDDWQQNIMQFFQPANQVVQPPSLDDYKEKKAIRVLSLFDGIGTGRFVLDRLGIEVEIYYASEIDRDAINVTVLHHANNVKQLGRIESITDAEVFKLCPLDLVIGGSPCNDLSLVNPNRRGLFDPAGTGKLFFDFFRILKTVQLANRGRHVFWLYENVASMPQEYKSIITRFLLCEPVMIDSKYFSPQYRARYFWGNIPGMYTIEEYWGGEESSKPLQPYFMEQNRMTVDDVLVQGLNRKALVEKVRTVTTRSNSLKQGKQSMLPVTMDGKGDVLWVTELEEIFGFPRHYTDVGNIPLGRRQQLLGKAWSVPVIKHLFTPLRSFFKTITSPNRVSSTASSPSSSSS